MPLPPLEEQRRIVNQVEAYRQEIKNLENRIEETRAMIDTAFGSVWAPN
jgi:restriction endonuclease S subunit